MRGALSLPGVKVDRKSFLTGVLRPYGDFSQFADGSPTDYYPIALIDGLADEVIKSHCLKATALSAAAGIPGGFASLGTIPADFAQYYWHYLVMAQKLAYLYGWPDLRDSDNNLGADAQAVLTLFMGSGLGMNVANAVIKEVAEQAAKQAIRRLSAVAITRGGLFPIVERIARAIGIRLTQEAAGRAAGKLIPLLGAAISGGITYASFRPMARKLKRELSAAAQLRTDSRLLPK